jgi:hypothetical protein
MYQSNNQTITKSLVDLIANVKLTSPAQPVDEHYMRYFESQQVWVAFIFVLFLIMLLYFV